MFTLAENFWIKLVEGDLLIPVLAVTFGCSIAIVAIVFGSVKAMVIAKERENTKRELAAYVAEGSLDPEKAIAMLEAGTKGSSGA